MLWLVSMSVCRLGWAEHVQLFKSCCGYCSCLFAGSGDLTMFSCLSHAAVSVLVCLQARVSWACSVVWVMLWLLSVPVYKLGWAEHIGSFKSFWSKISMTVLQAKVNTFTYASHFEVSVHVCCQAEASMFSCVNHAVVNVHILFAGWGEHRCVNHAMVNVHVMFAGWGEHRCVNHAVVNVHILFAGWGEHRWQTVADAAVQTVPKSCDNLTAGRCQQHRQIFPFSWFLHCRCFSQGKFPHMCESSWHDRAAIALDSSSEDFRLKSYCRQKLSPSSSWFQLVQCLVFVVLGDSVVFLVSVGSVHSLWSLSGFSAQSLKSQGVRCLVILVSGVSMPSLCSLSAQTPDHSFQKSSFCNCLFFWLCHRSLQNYGLSFALVLKWQ